jgi:hypothetical protein
MRTLTIPLSLLAIVICAGCSQMSPGRSTAMGAGPAPAAKVYCRDGAWMPTTGACGDHGGVERDTSAPAQK